MKKCYGLTEEEKKKWQRELNKVINKDIYATHNDDVFEWYSKYQELMSDKKRIAELLVKKV